jgi:hypothetical protein
VWPFARALYRQMTARGREAAVPGGDERPDVNLSGLHQVLGRPVGVFGREPPGAVNDQWLEALR